MCMTIIGCIRDCVNECTYTPTRGLQVTVYRSCNSKNIFVYRPYIGFFCFKWKAKKAKLWCSSIVTIVRPATRIGWWKVKDGDEVHEIQYMCGICSDPLWFCNTHTQTQPHFPSCHNMGRGEGEGEEGRGGREKLNAARLCFLSAALKGEWSGHKAASQGRLLSSQTLCFLIFHVVHSRWPPHGIHIDIHINLWEPSTTQQQEQHNVIVDITIIIIIIIIVVVVLLFF